MGNKFHITEDAILKKATQRSFERGVNYLGWGMVYWVTQRGDRLFSEVQGSECESYMVSVALSDDGFTAACSCPYDWGGYCKHIVATLLTFMQDDGDVEVRAPIEDLLSKLSADQLRTLVIRLVENNPNVVDAVDSFCVQGEASPENEPVRPY